jgi:hypothetical protein
MMLSEAFAIPNPRARVVIQEHCQPIGLSEWCTAANRWLAQYSLNNDRHLFHPSNVSSVRGPMKNDSDLITAIARTLSAGYVKDVTGVPGKWDDLSQEDRKIWTNAAKRAIRRIDELRLSKK